MYTERREGNLATFHYLFDKESLNLGYQGNILLSLDPEKWMYAELVVVEDYLYLVQSDNLYRDISYPLGTNLLLFFNTYNNEWQIDIVEQDTIAEEDYLIVTSKINLVKKYKASEGEYTPIALITYDLDKVFSLHPAIADRFWDGAKYQKKNVRLHLSIGGKEFSTEEQFSVLQLMQTNPKVLEALPVESPILNIESLSTLATEVTKLLTHREELPKSGVFDPEVVREKIIKGYRVTLHLPTKSLTRIFDITNLQVEITQVGKQYGFGTRLFFVPESEMTDIIPNEISGTFYLRSYSVNSIDIFTDRMLTIDTQIRPDPYRQLRKWSPRITSDPLVQQDRRIWKVELKSSNFDELIWCLSGIMRSHGRKFMKGLDPKSAMGQ